VWVISSEDARRVVELVATILPILALAFLASDRGRFRRADAAKINPRRLTRREVTQANRIRATAGLSPEECAERIDESRRHHLLSLKRRDALLGVIFVLVTAVGFSLAIVGLFQERMKPWILASVVASSAIAFDMLFAGVTVQLRAEFEANTPEQPEWRDEGLLSPVGQLLHGFINAAVWLFVTGMPVGIAAVFCLALKQISVR
jgi:hypothetical protein